MAHTNARSTGGALTIDGKPYRLRLPGPTESPQRVLNATARPVVNHRGPESAAVLSEAAALLRPILGTKNEILVHASSGTGVMEASLANTLVEGDRILILNNGQWGERFVAIATTLHRNVAVDTIDVPWGENVSVADLQNRLSKADYAAVVAIHNESSTGVYSDLEKLGSAVRDTDALFIVDSVSGAGGMPLDQDAWGIDILITASQKALMCPPGLGIVSISEKAWKKIESGVERARFYWDFRKGKKWAPEGQTAFTTAVTLVGGLLEALKMIHEEGVDHVFARHQTLSSKLREGCLNLGFSSYPTSPLVSNTVVALHVPDDLDGSDIVRHLYTEHGTVIGGSRNKLRGKVVRIGTMGAVTADDIDTDLAHLSETIASLREKAA